jgi:gluconate 2-dehydrogenase subunit 3-like protein
MTTELNRRSVLRMLSAAPVAAVFALTDAEAQQAHKMAQAARQAAARTGTTFKPKFFTPHEYATVRVLVDLIIPRDQRSGSATDAGVPEFMDFTMLDQPARQTAMRGGLAWLDIECQRRFDKTFLQCAEAQRTAVLDDIAGYTPADATFSPGVGFFRSFRDLTSSGFWTSKMGIEDLGYMGNTFVAEWTGCPSEVLTKLGLPTRPE